MTASHSPLLPPIYGGQTGGNDPRAVAPQAAPHRGFWRKLAAFSGPGYLVAVGYMDPGNWATGVAGGSAFGYSLLSVALIANLLAMVLQTLASKLGIATGLDLAQACRERYAAPVRIGLWVLCEGAIVACDLAEVIGSAIALNLLFGLPLVAGVCLTTLDVFLILALQRFGVRKLEAFIVGLIVIIGVCFAAEMVFAKPSLHGIAEGLIPSGEIITNPAMLYLAVGILGATVMPHNLYLHSSVVQSRNYPRTPAGRREAMKLSSADTIIALSLALLINAAIVILAAATFYRPGASVAVGIEEAYHLLTPMLGAGAASLLFGVALLAAGQNSTVTGTLAGQIVMEGFTDLRIPAWSRRLVSRLLAVVPAAVIAGIYGAEGTGKLLVLSQVVLSLQLPFAVIPLILITSDRRQMGEFASTRRQAAIYWAIAISLVTVNAALLLSFFR
ncbi:MAG: Nramp family divalent metal transporter [Hyphomonadaceae bacterium]|nr:Nramp family divalent metal transporter [Hyphomonadaceae bacterium]